jgi:glycosidase
MPFIQAILDPAVDAVFKQPARSIRVDHQQVQVPFSSPTDWRDQWIYFLLVDRFNSPHAAPRGTDPYLPYQGGTFEGIRQQLDYLQDLGVGAVWLSPVHYNPWWFGDYYGGYGIQDLLRIEPRFCKDPERALADPQLAEAEFRDLVDHIHARGIYVIADIVLNHMGDLFNYEGMQDAREWNPDGEYTVYWRDAQGVPRGDWTRIEAVHDLPENAGPSPRDLARNAFFRRRGMDGPELSQGDFYRLKELRTDFYDDATGTYPVRDILIRAYAWFMARFDIDGYRIDTLQYITRAFARTFGNAMREYALALGKKNFLCMGEVWDDSNEDQIANFIGRNTETDDGIIGVDTAIDFPMRLRLVKAVKNQGSPAELADHYDTRTEALRRISSSHGDAGAYFVTFLDNHDLNERFHVPGWELQTTMALTCLFTMIGIPCLYYGTEQGLCGRGATRESVREALWGQAAFDRGHPFYRTVQTLTGLRRQYPALRYGRQYFRPCSGDGVHFGHSPFRDGGIIAFARILSISEVVIVANTHTTRDQSVFIIVDRRLNGPGARFAPVFSNQADPGAPDAVVNTGSMASLRVHLRPMEVQLLVRP